MTPLAVIIFLAVCFLGTVLQAVSGFGLAITAMTILPFVLPYNTALAVTTLICLSTNVVFTIRMRRYIQWKRLVPVLIAFALTSGGIILLSVGQSDELLKKLLGGALVLFSIYFAFFNGRIQIKPRPRNGAIAGGLAGITTGLFGIGSPPMAVYLLSVCESNEDYFGSIQAYFTLSSIFTLGMRFTSGLITLEVGKWWLMGLIPLYLGMFVGKKIFDRMNPAILRRVVYVFMAISGLSMVLQ